MSIIELVEYRLHGPALGVALLAALLVYFAVMSWAWTRD